MLIDKCESHSCIHGDCVGDQDSNGYRCLCNDGFVGDFCDIDIDECNSSPCLNNGTCIDLVNSYSCDCKPG